MIRKRPHVEARFNRSETTRFSEPYTAPATVAALTDGNCVGRRGIYAGLRLELGPCAALQVGGITVVVSARPSWRVAMAVASPFSVSGEHHGTVGKARPRAQQTLEGAVLRQLVDAAEGGDDGLARSAVDAVVLDDLEIFVPAREVRRKNEGAENWAMLASLIETRLEQ